MNNDSIKQYFLITLIIALAIVVGTQLFAFFPGLLGAVTLYILLRQYYFKLTVIKTWKKGWAAAAFILGGLVVFVLPWVGLANLLIPKFVEYFDNVDQLTKVLTTTLNKARSVAPWLNLDKEQINNLVQKATSAIPIVLGATANMLTNTVIAFFILYFMLVDGRKMELTLHKYIPLKDNSIDNLWEATRVMVVSNAIGIPVLAICQAIVAIAGYWIFGIESYVLWGVITGLFSIVPVVGTAVVWVPICVYLLAIGKTGECFGLVAYSLLITGTVDNILRFTILRKLGDVHPIITALGIIVGIPLFGFMGFIFGPLLLSYLLLLIKIYRVEFSAKQE